MADVSSDISTLVRIVEDGGNTTYRCPCGSHALMVTHYRSGTFAARYSIQCVRLGCEFNKIPSCLETSREDAAIEWYRRTGQDEPKPI